MSVQSFIDYLVKYEDYKEDTLKRKYEQYKEFVKENYNVNHYRIIIPKEYRNLLGRILKIVNNELDKNIIKTASYRIGHSSFTSHKILSCCETLNRITMVDILDKLNHSYSDYIERLKPYRNTNFNRVTSMELAKIHKLIKTINKELDARTNEKNV